MKLSIKIFSILSLIFLGNQLSAQNTTDTTLIVNGVCDMCKKKIETAALQAGAESAEWDVATHLLSLRYQSEETSLDAIGKAINGVGYDTEMESAEEKAYNSLHNCCKYRDPAVIDDHSK